MRLAKVETTVSNTEVLASQGFHVRSQDMGHILEILRKRMYKDPIMACVREYCANARDAHREIGQPDLPIQITLPTELFKQIEIRDFGPGISPRRMGEIFLNYGASTKRHTNKFQGSFGIGGKSAFAYTDCFTVISNYNGTERHYNAVIDESRCGRMDLIKEIKNDERNGVRIIIPVKETDFKAFSTAVVNSTKHWNPKWGTGSRPDVRNLSSAMGYSDVVEPLVSGDNWELHSFSSDYYDRMNVIVDGIAYKIEPSNLNLTDEWANSLIKKKLAIYYPVGKVSISSSRDELHFDEKTRKAIFQSLVKINNELVKYGLEKVAEQKNLWDAEIFWNEFIENIITAKNIKAIWNGEELKGLKRNVKRDDSVNDDIIIQRYIHAKKRTGGYKIVTDKRDEIIIGKRNALIINDLDSTRGLKKRIKAFFDENQGMTRIYLIKFGNDETRLRWMNELGLKHMNVLNASTLPQPVKEKSVNYGVRKPRSETFSGWIYSLSYYGERESERYLKPITIHKHGVGGIFVEIGSKRSREFKSSNQFKIGDYELRNIHAIFPDLNIHIIPSNRVKGLGSAWKRLEDIIVDRLVNLMLEYNDSYIQKIKEAYAFSFYNMESRREIQSIVEKGMVSATSLMSQFKNESDKVKQQYNDIQTSRIAREKFSFLIPQQNQTSTHQSSHPIVSLNKRIMETYPILSVLSYKAKDSDIADYINLVDKSVKNTRPQAVVLEPENYCVSA